MRNRKTLSRKTQYISAGNRLRFEQLENRRLLAIVWANEFGTGADAPDFDVEYSADESIARAIVNRAIDDWNSVVLDQDFDNDSNPSTNDFQLRIFAADIGGTTRGVTGITEFTHGGSGQSGWNVGVPTTATVILDDNGGGFDWFFDQTPLDDAEFTAIVNSGSNGTGPAFQASFVDVEGGHVDFYRTIVHEIGHALGITGNPNAAIAGMLTELFYDSSHNNAVTDPTGLSSIHLERFESTLSNPQYGVTATFIGGHIYEGDV